MTGVGSGGRTRDLSAADIEDAALKGRRYVNRAMNESVEWPTSKRAASLGKNHRDANTRKGRRYDELRGISDGGVGEIENGRLRKAGPTTSAS